MMPGELPYLAWQREYNQRWINYSFEECCLINRAARKGQKTITLPSTDPKKKLSVNLERMYQKNIISGFEQRVRCLIFNRHYFCWSWKDDYNYFICYTPHIAFYLEVAYEKKLKKINIFVKDDYEIDLTNWTQLNKETKHVRSLNRAEVSFRYNTDSAITNINVLRSVMKCETFIRRLSSENEDRIRSVVFDLPVSEIDASISNPLPSTSHQEIITALSEEVQASSSTVSDTSAHVDPECPEAKYCHVYFENSTAYNATLNFTSLKDNSNKFFIIQLLKFDEKNKYVVWYHWGRVGYKGQTNLINFGNSLDKAKSTFEKKFYDKTHNHWIEKNNFQRVPSKYDLIHLDLAVEESKPLAVAETKLDKKVQDLLKMICNKKDLEDAAKELSYDSNVTPIGKITAKQILEGYAVLNEISGIVNSGRSICKELTEACSNFYTKIPHNFGRKTPPIISTAEQIGEKMKMLEALSNICLALDVINDASNGTENPVDKYYRSLECQLIPLDHSSQEFKALNKYLQETHGPTHSTYTMDLIDAFQCTKESEHANFADFGNKRLLWHGSRTTNWLGILKKGLKIAPPEAPSSGYMFGKGIYFADCSSKSANYCFATKKKNEGLLLLCEVSLGKTLDVFNASDFSDLPPIFNSVYGVGRMQPENFQRTVLSPDADVPFGPVKQKVRNPDLSLIYNEYVVFSGKQVRMKYLLQIKFNFVC